jgi:hypothetical protein
MCAARVAAYLLVDITGKDVHESFSRFLGLPESLQDLISEIVCCWHALKIMALVLRLLVGCGDAGASERASRNALRRVEKAIVKAGRGLGGADRQCSTFLGGCPKICRAVRQTARHTRV